MNSQKHKDLPLALHTPFRSPFLSQYCSTWHYTLHLTFWARLGPFRTLPRPPSCIPSFPFPSLHLPPSRSPFLARYCSTWHYKVHLTSGRSQSQRGRRAGPWRRRATSAAPHSQAPCTPPAATSRTKKQRKKSKMTVTSYVWRIYHPCVSLRILFFRKKDSQNQNNLKGAGSNFRSRRWQNWWSYLSMEWKVLVGVHYI